MDIETFNQKHARAETLQAKINEMTVGERYSNGGQSLIDEFGELLDELRQSGYAITLNFW